MEVTTLRIDNAERMASQLADQEISPTQYMVSFLRQRGWQLPNTTLTIPNVIPEVAQLLPPQAAQCKVLFEHKSASATHLHALGQANLLVTSGF